MEVETLESRLRQLGTDTLVLRVQQRGDPARGALLYHNPEVTCIRCHEPAQEDGFRLGPAIAEINRDVTTEFLIDSLLRPSDKITDGFQTETLSTIDGKQITGLVVEEEESKTGTITLVDPNQDGKQYQIAKPDIEERAVNEVSAMPTGLVGVLNDEQSFYDLVRFLVEVKKGGPQAALRLRPPESFFAVTPLPDYESRVDHRTLIDSLDPASLDRGKTIYQRFCARCHGTKDQEGTMPSALRFAEGSFKNGTDPQSMYRTLTHGYGSMVAQRWMVPKQKYDVIHYIRETFLKSENPDQHFTISDDYLAGLPVGDDLGPDPVDKTPWSDMDYGNFLMNTYEVGEDGTNIAYKGIAVRLDKGPGGVSQGRHWILYEHDTMRVAAAWSAEMSGNGFIDYNGIHFNDRHNIHPRIVGDVHLSNDHRPGWANPKTDSFDVDPRVVGRDGKLYGPLPAEWLKYRGLYQFGDRVVMNYTVGKTTILESPSMNLVDQNPVFHRNLNISARNKPLLVRIADVRELKRIDSELDGSIAFAARSIKPSAAEPGFNGTSHLVGSKTIDWNQNLTIVARIKTSEDGTIVCQTEDGPEWVPGGTSLFIRGGHLVFDIGWVDCVTSDDQIDDNEWHDVALVWQPEKESVRLYIDGDLDQDGELSVGKPYEKPVLRIGYTAENFPNDSLFHGDISNLKILNRALTNDEIRGIDFERNSDEVLANWSFTDNDGNRAEVRDRSATENHARWVTAGPPTEVEKKNTWAFVRGIVEPDWQIVDDSLCLRIPAGPDPLNLTIVQGANSDRVSGWATRDLAFETQSQIPLDLSGLVNGGPNRYPKTLNSKIETMPLSDTDPFAVDFLTHPEDNRWSCRMRLTGIDFRDADTAYISAWDGSVWELTGFSEGDSLAWRRIANGLFQPLGIKLVNDKIYVTCRDQLVMLEDLNNDGAIDLYRAFNSDHQVTEHFHEFAMGLQADDDGNFYYAKSARHALPALVPHHGTLLKISADGSSTKIIGKGFRAANGVCLNPDGTFFVTDQEGHWTPKNRINWVRGNGEFYGNMMGYHDVQDESDSAMEQPLCWITNTFDRSPGELMWVPEGAWGSLSGSLLNLSYGMGQVFVVPHQQVGTDEEDQLQGGTCALPIPLFPTGIMRGRFHNDGHLYCCGMYAWAGNQQKPGGMYRIRNTGQPSWLPRDVRANTESISIEFTDGLDSSATETDRYVVQTWDILRTRDYGSKHIDEKQLRIESVELMGDGKTIKLKVPELSPTKCMEIKCRIRTADGRELIRTVNNTIHAVEEAK